MAHDLALAFLAAALGAYGAWGVRRDARCGRTSSRGLRFDRTTQPRRYRAVMAINAVAVVLLLAGAVTEGARVAWLGVSSARSGIDSVP